MIHAFRRWAASLRRSFRGSPRDSVRSRGEDGGGGGGGSGDGSGGGKAEQEEEAKEKRRSRRKPSRKEKRAAAKNSNRSAEKEEEEEVYENEGNNQKQEEEEDKGKGSVRRRKGSRKGRKPPKSPPPVALPGISTAMVAAGMSMVSAGDGELQSKLKKWKQSADTARFGSSFALFYPVSIIFPIVTPSIFSVLYFPTSRGT